MRLYPAIDLRDGRCVRLVQGDFDKQTLYADDPVAVALAFEAAGAEWIHVVDLDAARTGEPVNRPVISAICAALGIPVQSGGGVRSVDSASELIDAGVSRVVIGTAAVENPGMVAEIARRRPGQVAVGLDHRDGVLRVHGWLSKTEVRLLDAITAAAEAGAGAVVITDVARDGGLVGPDLSGLAEVLSMAPIGPTFAVIASGGVGSIADLLQLAQLDGNGATLDGAIVGKALYEGHFGLAEALAAISAGPVGPADPEKGSTPTTTARTGRL